MRDILSAWEGAFRGERGSRQFAVLQNGYMLLYGISQGSSAKRDAVRGVNGNGGWDKQDKI